MIEPLSIYSNVSPPNELNDVSFPDSRLSLGQLQQSRPQNSTASQTQQSLNEDNRYYENNNSQN